MFFVQCGFKLKFAFLLARDTELSFCMGSRFVPRSSLLHILRLDLENEVLSVLFEDLFELTSVSLPSAFDGFLAVLRHVKIGRFIQRCNYDVYSSPDRHCQLIPKYLCPIKSGG